jgi:hypothetical protein
MPGNYAISIIICAAINELEALNAGLTFIAHESLGSYTPACAPLSIRERAIYPADFITCLKLSMKNIRLFQVCINKYRPRWSGSTPRRGIVNVTAPL